MYRISVLPIIFGAVVAGGCTGGVGYTASVSTQGYAPDLVYVSPGVMVIADYDEPIFYVDNFYWRIDGGTWYRSRSYTGGWVGATPPPTVARIQRPHQYVHYRPSGYVSHRERVRPTPTPVVRDHRDNRPRVEPRPQPVVRDHREDRPRVEPRPQPPIVRDHREDRSRVETRPQPPGRANPSHERTPPQGHDRKGKDNKGNDNNDKKGHKDRDDKKGPRK